MSEPNNEPLTNPLETSKTLSDTDRRLINEAFFQKLMELRGSKEESVAIDAVNEFTRLKMWTLTHIPLHDELGKVGRIYLDKDGESCVLTGKEPVLKEHYERQTTSTA